MLVQCSKDVERAQRRVVIIIITVFSLASVVLRGTEVPLGRSAVFSIDHMYDHLESLKKILMPRF